MAYRSQETESRFFSITKKRGISSVWFVLGGAVGMIKPKQVNPQLVGTK